MLFAKGTSLMWLFAVTDNAIQAGWNPWKRYFQYHWLLFVALVSDCALCSV